jgi:hypothetical protein
MLARFVPKSQFNSVPQPELVVDNAKVVLDDVLGRAEDLSDFRVLQPLGD